MNFLNAFRPLVSTIAGRKASELYNIPPFIDGSIRREPDLECPLPSISALCRGDRFVPRLHPGDKVIYIAIKRAYPPVQELHWRLVAALRVIERFRSHHEAALWYSDRKMRLPNNCLVPGNPPTPVERSLFPLRDPREWELGYQARARKTPTFVVCEPIYLEVYDPPVINENDMIDDLGRIPGLQNPPALSDKVYERFISKFIGHQKNTK